jgi:ribonuclease HI
MATVKALQKTETIQINKNILKTILIHTDSRITLDSLKNMKNRNYLIEAIKNKTIALEKENWHIECTWIKAHAGYERK